MDELTGLGAGGWLVGRVYALGAHPLPLGGARVRVAGHACITEADGRYQLPLPAGMRAVSARVSCDGHYERVEALDVSGAQPGRGVIYNFHLLEQGARGEGARGGRRPGASPHLRREAPPEGDEERWLSTFEEALDAALSWGGAGRARASRGRRERR